MALDTSIPMSYNPSAKLDIEGAYNFAMNRRKNALLEQNAQMEMAEKQNALRQQRELRNFMATADFNDPTQMTRLAALDPKVAADMAQFQSSMSTRDKNRADFHVTKTKGYRDELYNVNTPQDAAAWITSIHSDPDMAGSPISKMPLEQAIAMLPKDEAGLQEWKNKAAIGMTEYVKTYGKPKLEFLNTGSNLRPTNPYTGQQAGSAIPLSVSPDVAARVQAMKDERINPQDYPNLYQAVAEGRIPLSRVNGRTAGIYEGVLAKNPDINLNDLNLDQLSGQAGARTAGTTKANIGIASDEANRMIVVARDIIPRVKLSEFRSLNAIENWAKTHTGDRDIVALNASLNSLINSYARAINPKGVGTVSDKNHAREMINSAMSSGQLESVLNVMQQEMEAALGAARAGSGSQKPAAGAAPAASTTGPVKITSDAQFEKLPSGTLFVGPDGKQRRKP